MIEDKKSLLLKKYSSKGTVGGKELIVHIQYCVDFIKDCTDMQLAIIGADGFILHDDGSHEGRLDEIADFSKVIESNWERYIDRCNRSAMLFMEEMLKNGKSNGFSFVIFDIEDGIRTKRFPDHI